MTINKRLTEEAGYTTITISNDKLLDMLIDRVNNWVEDRKEANLYYKMYERYVDDGLFEYMEKDFDPMGIVDNDCVNYCKVIYEGDEDFDTILESYKEDEYDISMETDYGSIEATDDENNPTMFLVRKK